MRKIRHKTLEFEKNTQEVSTAKNQDTSRKSGKKEKKKITQKRRIHPNVKKQSDIKNDTEESPNNVPKKAR